MRIRRLSPVRLCCFAAVVLMLGTMPVVSSAGPAGGPSAAVILHRAEAKARAGHKNILLEFGASWCINCKLYDRMLKDPAMHAILSQVFVFTTMDTGERPGDTRHANTPGGVAFEDHVGGKGAGWPFLVILNPEGKPIINSYRPDAKSKTGRANIGYPVLPREIDWFMMMLRRGAPAMSHKDRARVRAWLTAEARRIQQG